MLYMNCLLEDSLYTNYLLILVRLQLIDSEIFVPQHLWCLTLFSQADLEDHWMLRYSLLGHHFHWQMLQVGEGLQNEVGHFLDEEQMLVLEV